VTVNPRQRGFGRDGAAREARGAGGGFARPDYGANSPPKYPPLAREKGYEGTVYLRALVERDGRVGNLLIDRSSGHEILDKAAVDSVRGWTFLPAQKDGKPVASWVLLPVKFVLK
jgi:protein TonB